MRRTNVTSGLPCVLHVSVVLLMVFASICSRAHAKRGCSAFGHSCFGGHGKRFDPQLQGELPQVEKTDEIDKIIEDYGVPPSSNDLFPVEPDRKFAKQEDNNFQLAAQPNVERLDPYALSLFVEQWLASHRRSHHPDSDVNMK